jgi:hypothetical protein
MIENASHHSALHIFLNVSAGYFGVNYNRSLALLPDQAASEPQTPPKAH